MRTKSDPRTRQESEGGKVSFHACVKNDLLLSYTDCYVFVASQCPFGPKEGLDHLFFLLFPIVFVPGTRDGYHCPDS